MTPTTKVNDAAPLRNVAAFMTLMNRMVDRDLDLPGLAVFSGKSGWGKSKAAMMAGVRHRAIYVECGQFTTAKDLLILILKELNVDKPHGSISMLLWQAIELIAAERRPVIVDEAHFIAKKRFVDLLREISDKATATVVLIGEEMLPAHLEEHERVHNRVLEWLPAVPCDASDFKLLAATRCKGLEIAPDLADAILQETKGNTRRIVINLSKAQQAAQLQGIARVDLAAFGGREAIEREHKHRARA